MAAVACNLAGSTTVGLSGQMINIAFWGVLRLDECDDQPVGVGNGPADSSMEDDADTVTSQGHRGTGKRREGAPGPPITAPFFCRRVGPAASTLTTHRNGCRLVDRPQASDNGNPTPHEPVA
jgi:hypothetical protein